jgi:hypothetical protein
MPVPPEEGISLVDVVRVAIVDRRDPALHVIQDLADHEAQDADGGHIARGCSPQIMEPKN